jgi:excisionase family DNA binding protein
MEGPKVLTIDQAAKELGVCRNLVYQQVRAGKLPGWLRIGDRWLIGRERWEKFLSGEQSKTGTT